MVVQIPLSTPQNLFIFHVKHFVNFPANTKAVLFDMDGVIFNTEDLAHDAFVKLGLEFGGTFEETDHKAILGSTQSYWSHYLMEKWSVSMGEGEFRALFWKLLEEQTKNKIAFMPGFFDCIENIHAKSFKIALVTSSPRFEVESLLKRFNIHHFFDEIVAGDEISRGKPDPSPYLLAMKRLSLSPGDCVVIEDSLSGVRSGKAAVCFVIAVPTSHADGLNYEEADVVLKSSLKIGRAH